MVARTFKEGWNLRDQWDAALANYSLFPRFFGENGLSALQVISLQHGDGIRQADVLRLDASIVRKHWKKALDALNQAVTFLYNECGVWFPTWLPYPAMLITLAGVALKEKDLQEHKAMLQKWFFSRTFGRRYEVAANTVAIEETELICEVVDGIRKLSGLEMSATVIEAASRRRQGAIWRGVICALAANGATNLHGTKLNTVDDLVPINVLREQEQRGRREESPHLLALGFVLTTRHEAREVGGRGAGALDEFLAGLSKQARDRLLKRQLLPYPVNSDQEFLERRCKLLSEFLERKTGQGLSWDDDG